MKDRNNRSTELTVAGTHGDERLQVSVPAHVGDEIEQRIANTEFDSADEYVTFVLQSFFRELDQQDDDVGVAGETQRTDPEESALLQDRLESLGYL